jgi:hypothetical protein
MKKLIYSFIIIFSFSLAHTQEDTKKSELELFYQVLSPSYSLSYAKVNSTGSGVYTAASNGLSLSLFRYGFRKNIFECSGGFSFHYLSTKIDSDNKSLDLRFSGFTPEIRAKVFPLGLKNGLFVGTGAQFFVFPYASGEIRLNAFRPMFLTGVSKEYGFTVFLVPPILSGVTNDINLNKDWYLGMEVDIPWSKLF